MPDFSKWFGESDPPEPSSEADKPIEGCPNALPPKVLYKLVAVVSTRAGDIALEGLEAFVDGASIGKTDATGRSPESSVRCDTEATVNVQFENATQALKREVYSLRITGIDAEAGAFTAGDATNFIAKVQDVFGSGSEGFGGDKDFKDTYAASADVRMTDTASADVKLLTVTVRMATISLNVPYLSQVGPGERVQIAAPTPANPAGRTQTFRGSIICMPTAAKMCIDYWGITAAGGGDLSRNDLMQECWDEHDNPSVNYPCPWQKWSHLRTVTGDLVEAAHPGTYTVSSGPASTGGDSASIPSDYADGILGEIAAGQPVVTSTYATDGHVMTVRGAVVKNDGSAEWLILNDPYGNLATEDSVYDVLDISAPVGLRGDAEGPMNQPQDVRAVRDVLTRFGDYTGALDAPIDEADETDATVVAIRAFQGGSNPDGRVDPGENTEKKMNKKLKKGTKSTYSTVEDERNVAGGDNAIGQHVYYNGGTEAKGPGGSGRFRLKAQAWTLVIEKSVPLTKDEIKGRLVRAQ